MKLQFWLKNTIMARDTIIPVRGIISHLYKRERLQWLHSVPKMLPIEPKRRRFGAKQPKRRRSTKSSKCLNKQNDVVLVVLHQNDVVLVVSVTTSVLSAVTVAFLFIILAKTTHCPPQPTTFMAHTKEGPPWSLVNPEKSREQIKKIT